MVSIPLAKTGDSDARRSSPSTPSSPATRRRRRRVRQHHVVSHSNGKDLAIEHRQDVEPILEWNRQARREEQKSDWGRHVARIPNVIYVKWLDEERGRGNINLRLFTPEFDAIVQKKLQDPDWAYLRVDKPALQVGFLGK
jgi:hypothetical protein